MSETKQKHKWQQSPYMENWQICQHCGQKRRRANFKYFYEEIDISKTYCEQAKRLKEIK